MAKNAPAAFDRTIYVVVFLLIGIGIVMLYSASSLIAMEQFENAGFFLKRHLIRLIMGLVVMLIMMHFNYQHLKKLSPMIYLGSILLLLFTLGYFWSNNIDRPARWLPMGFFSLQTSDIAKYAVVIYLAAYMSRQPDRLREFKRGLFPALLMVGLCIGLVVIQPDFSTAATIGLIAFFLLFLGRAKLWHLASIGGAFALTGAGIILRSPYKLERLRVYLNPTSDILDAGYQTQQALISLGNGGFLGMGLGDSFEKNLFLPEPHTDFIFAIIGEELGFIGAAVVLFLFLLLFLQTLRIARQAPDLFGMYLTAGLGGAIFFYAVLHAGVVTGLLPPTGLPLPFISYGGSQLVTGMAAIGIILNVSRQRREHKSSAIW